MEEILKDLQNRFDLTEVIKKDEVRTIITAKKEDIRPLLLHLKTFSGFTHLVLISAVDYIEDNKFQLTYILHNYDLKKYILLRVFIDRENPIMESIHPLWKQARVYQREIREMMGINFPGSPDVDKPLILEGWENMPPMRKDFNTLSYVAQTYFPRPGRKTYDPREYMKKKLYPEEELKNES